ncbi:hypothetical protein NQ042_08115 [Corynebacterium phoceense]|uniref:hypothetical protein n=1 Tax=Corynebacterium phoceense TaxID=1686286 RepID=UPI001DF0E12D|nr:hypothetical protein [Corynebacterium phoceense]MCQ9334049.1 hypothetical protein [Corynebacterium phoceense]MCQ9337256.1 hypothetical protein [Corynebacterium phoceense]HJG44658.1 hypothetical protein [Corynebacterium phoceense]
MAKHMKRAAVDSDGHIRSVVEVIVSPADALPYAIDDARGSLSDFAFPGLVNVSVARTGMPDSFAFEFVFAVDSVAEAHALTERVMEEIVSRMPIRYETGSKELMPA